MTVDRAISEEQYRDTLARFATGVTVVSTEVDGILHGMTANAFSSLSLDPLLVLVCIERTTGMHELLPHAKTFAATMLAAGQERESVFFASTRRPSGRDQYDDVAWIPAPVTGAPVLSEGLAFVDCRVAEMLDGGDHSIFIGEVLDLGILQPDGEPLIYFGHRYRRLVKG
ncbi:MAG: flavin reductase family protein [Egibacteraceae bacterium]